MTDKQIDFFKNITKGKFITQQNLDSIEEQRVQRVIENVNESAEIPKKFAQVRANQFSFSFDVTEFATRCNNDKICLVIGTVGRGKTTMLCCAIHERAVAGLAAGYYISNMLLDVKLRSLRSFSARETEFDFYKKLGNVPFLCIDEVGTSGNADEERYFLRRILALRYDNMLPTMIATNMTNTQFKKFMLGIDQIDINKDELNSRCKADPIMDRLFSVVEPIKMIGEESFRNKQ